MVVGEKKYTFCQYYRTKMQDSLKEITDENKDGNESWG